MNPLPPPPQAGRVAAVEAIVGAVRSAARPSSGPPPESLVSACDVVLLVDLAIAEGLAGPVHRALAPLIPPDQASRLARQAGLDKARHLAYLAMLRRFADALGQAGVPWVVLKGPVLAELVFPDMIRGYADLDLLVPPSRLGPAVEALEDVGASLAAEDWAAMARRVKGELSLDVAAAPVIDLHWHPVYLRRARERWRIPTDELLERRQPARLGDLDAWVLDPEDFTALVALHASFSSVQQLRRLLDVERTVAVRPPDWEKLVERCRAWRVGLPVAVMLSRARLGLGAAVPVEVIRDLAPEPLNRLAVHRLGAWARPAPPTGHRSVRSGLTRCLRDGLRSTTAEFATATGQAIAHSLRTRLGWAPPPAAGPGTGARAGFDRYLRLVEGADRYGRVAAGGRSD